MYFDGINLALKEKDPMRPSVLVPAIIGVCLAVALLAKFAVIDRYNKMYALQSQASSLEATNTALNKSLEEYDDVLAQYNLYSTSFMTDNEKALVEKEEMLKLIDDVLVKSGDVLSINSSSNVVTAEITGISLDEASNLVDILNARDDVESVSVSNAKSVEIEEKVTKDDVDESEATEAEAAEAEASEDTEEAEEETIIRTISVISITIVMRQVAEEVAQS